MGELFLITVVGCGTVDVDPRMPAPARALRRLDAMTLLMLAFLLHSIFASSSVKTFAPRLVSIGIRNVTTAQRFAETQQFLNEALRQRLNIGETRLKAKIVEIMKQAMYSAQERLWPMEQILAKYDNSTPYRMAFIYMKLEQLHHEGRGIMRYLHLMRRHTNKHPITKIQRVQVYWQLVRRNVDVTYLVDFILDRVPRDRDKVEVLRDWVARKEKEDMQKMLLRQRNSG